jgi:multidrug efflux pump subunit AcrA (membrane-fusion protein)
MRKALKQTILALLVAVPIAGQAQTDNTAQDWVEVKDAGTSVFISLGGTVIPYKEVTLAAQIPGRVQSIAGIEGDAFDAGAELVTIGDTEIMAQRNAALAALANAEADMRNADVQYNRELWAPRTKQAMGGMGMPNLFDDMFSRPMQDMVGDYDNDAARSADLYSSRTRIQQARNAILQAQSQIQALDAKLRDARSVAPFVGVITHKHVEVGDTVQPGQPLLSYADVEFLQVVVDVPSRVAPNLTQGQMLEAELDVNNERVPVRVAQVFPMADLVRHTVKVKFDLPQGVSRPGMYIKVLIPDNTVSSGGMVKIPVSAVRFNGSLPGVYVKGESGRPQLRLVRIGENIGDDYIMVTSGLQAGEMVQRNPGFN